ncbi:MAG: mceD [Marmoricola sp.]|nr:mceD [Marmoricola sp.]
MTRRPVTQRPVTQRTGIGVLVVALVASMAFVLWPRAREVRISADFVSSVGVYKGSEVRLMGVPIGKVTSIVPDGDHVRVAMTYSARYRLPANAGAVIISPSVVADRFVQLTGQSSAGSGLLASGDRIPLSRTRVPVELDRVYRTVHDLLDALGPQGVNKQGANDTGAVNRVLHVGAQALDGNGAELHRMLVEVSGATGTLGDSSADFFASVSSLEQLTSTLAGDDGQVRAFNRQMAEVIGFLADERGSLGSVLDSLARSFGRVRDFVQQNRAELVGDVSGLVTVTAALVREKRALAEVIHTVPVGIDNLNRTWDPKLQGARSRANVLTILQNSKRLICDELAAIGIPQVTPVCNALLALLGGKR